MLVHSKRKRLWNSSKNLPEHAIQLGNMNGQTKVHLSGSKFNLSLVFVLLITSGISIFAVLVIINSPVINRFHELESTLSLFRQLSFILVFYSIYLTAAIMALAIKNLILNSLSQATDLILLITLVFLLTPFSLLYSFQPIMLTLNLCICILLLVIAKWRFKHYTYAGVNFYIATCLVAIAGVSWGIQYFISLPASTFTKVLIFSTFPFLMIIIPSKFLQMLELYDVVCRNHWRRPRHPFPHLKHMDEPFVSIHVPTYSEPPKLVIQTLNRLSEINYTNFEVIVIDNNTKDSSLWLPVQDHCKKLGSNFRFMHVDNLTGAKGGALNYVHKFINPRATIIGVIDADYQPDKDFLNQLIGHFNDPKIGFVQTPHDYRAWRDNLFLTMCYWEYKIFFHTTMISLNERDAGITVGTMCLVRKEALEKAGGWSEWCVTEDSELAIRIHDIGYSSIYVDKTYGHGLIPDSFEGYKMQRYRWTAGPIQEFRHYYKHFIGLSKRDSELTLIQRIFHLNHGLGNTLIAFNIPYILLGVAIVMSMILHQEVVAVPIELWLTATLTLITAPLLTFLLYRVTVKASVMDILGQAVATMALSHVVFHSAFRTAITGNANWNRTSKFKSRQSYLLALASTKEEISIGMSLMAFVIVSYLIFPYQGLSLMVLIGIAYVAISYFAAPLMAAIGVWSFKHEQKNNT